MQPAYDLLRTFAIVWTPSTLSSHPLMVAHGTASANAVAAKTEALTTTVTSSSSLSSSSVATVGTSNLSHNGTSLHGSPVHGPISVSVTEATPVRAPLALSTMRAHAAANAAASSTSIISASIGSVPPTTSATTTTTTTINVTTTSTTPSAPSSRTSSLSAVPAVVLTLRRPSSPNQLSFMTSTHNGSPKLPALIHPSSSPTASITGATPSSPKFVLYPTSTMSALQSCTSISNLSSISNRRYSSPRTSPKSAGIVAALAAGATLPPGIDLDSLGLPSGSLTSTTSSSSAPPTFFLPPSPAPAHVVGTISLAPISPRSSIHRPVSQSTTDLSHHLLPAASVGSSTSSTSTSSSSSSAAATTTVSMSSSSSTPPIIPLPPTFTLDQLVSSQAFCEAVGDEVTAIEHSLSLSHDRLELYICMIQYLKYLDKEVQLSSSPLSSPVFSPSSTNHYHVMEAQSKLHYIASIACSNLKKYPPSPLIAPTLLDLANSHANTIVTTSNDNTTSPAGGGGMSGVGINGIEPADQPLSAMGAIRLALTGSTIEFRKFDTSRPPYAALQSVDRIMELKEAAAAARVKKTKRLDIRHSRLAYTDRYVRNSYSHVAATAVIATVEDMWMQVDPRPDRLIRLDRGDPHIPDGVEEIVTSITSGRLVLTRDTLTWTPEISLGETHPAPPTTLASSISPGGIVPSRSNASTMAAAAPSAVSSPPGGHFRSNSFTHSRRVVPSSYTSGLSAINEPKVISHVQRGHTLLALNSPKNSSLKDTTPTTSTGAAAAPLSSTNGDIGSPLVASPPGFARRAHAHTKSNVVTSAGVVSVNNNGVNSDSPPQQSEAMAATSPLKKWRPNRSTAPAGTSFWPVNTSQAPSSVWGSGKAGTSSGTAAGNVIAASSSMGSSTATILATPAANGITVSATPVVVTTMTSTEGSSTDSKTVSSSLSSDGSTTPPMPPVAAITPLRSRTSVSSSTGGTGVSSTHTTAVNILPPVPASPPSTPGHRRVTSDGSRTPSAATTNGGILEIKLDPPLPGAVEIDGGGDDNYTNGGNGGGDEYISLAAALRLGPGGTRGNESVGNTRPSSATLHRSSNMNTNTSASSLLPSGRGTMLTTSHSSTNLATNHKKQVTLSTLSPAEEHKRKQDQDDNTEKVSELAF
jgi:hypothetical protein